MTTSISRTVFSDLGYTPGIGRNPLPAKPFPLDVAQKIAGQSPARGERKELGTGAKGDGYNDGYRPEVATSDIKAKSLRAVAELRTAYINKLISDARSRASGNAADAAALEAAVQVASGAIDGRSAAFTSSGVSTVTVLPARPSAVLAFGASNVAPGRAAATTGSATPASPASSSDGAASGEQEAGSPAAGAAASDSEASSAEAGPTTSAGDDPTDSGVSPAENDPESPAAAPPDDPAPDSSSAQADSGATPGSSGSGSGGSGSSSSGGLLGVLRLR